MLHGWREVTDAVGVQGSYLAMAAIFALAILAMLVGGIAYVVVFSVAGGYGSRDSEYGPVDESGTQHAWSPEERERFKRRQRFALVVAGLAGLALFGVGLWVIWLAIP
jgi:hypothetical protein